MSIYAGLARGFYAYASDDGVTYNVGLALENGAGGGFSAATAGENPAYPRGFVMRHVYGVAEDGTRSMLPIAAAGNGLFVGGGTFSKGGKDFVVEGRIGEKRTYKGG